MPDGRPTSGRSGFVWMSASTLVEEVVDQWSGPNDAFFKIRMMATSTFCGKTARHRTVPGLARHFTRGRDTPVAFGIALTPL